jgi:hypothetical protein
MEIGAFTRQKRKKSLDLKAFEGVLYIFVE